MDFTPETGDSFALQCRPMSQDHILAPLNSAQLEAVTSPARATLVLAGAGSGKTRVLTHRLAWQVEVMGLSPWSILAVTFTNKAAAEMRARVEALLTRPTSGLWIGTFHGLSHRLLRQHWQEAGLPQSFQILDADDQLRLVKRIVREAGLDDARWPAKLVAGYIGARKEEGIRPASIPDNGDPIQRQFITLYQDYEAVCRRSGLVDFSELLLRAVELLRDNPPLLEHYRQRFRHLLVDEFQDSNSLQYAWLRLLAGESVPVFAVGDDDQSIYGWRGARIEHIQHFSRDFPGTHLVRLEQNYRSTGTILAAANAVIAHNQGRLGKSLWTEGEDGAPIDYYSAYNEHDEAQFVTERLRKWTESGRARGEAAILYRSNAQSRVLEDALIRARLPYRIYGGLRFFERAEIRDMLAYLRLIANRDDDAAFERVVNTPARGIGEKTLETLREQARHHGASLWQTTMVLLSTGVLPARAAGALRGFLALLESLSEATRELTLEEQVQYLADKSGLLEMYRNDKSGDRGEAKAENIEELANAARGFAPDDEMHAGMRPLDAFLAHASLEAGEAQGQAWEDCVQMMTLHSAKGLEFPLVFMVGMEEGLFPHQMSIDEPGRLEEERRLAYVGITRAREQLVLTTTEHRRLHGRDTYPQASRFVGEIPASLLRDVRPRAQISRPVWSPPAQAQTGSGFRIGQSVRHPKFGEGVIIGHEGAGEHARVHVNFGREGSKWLILAYANLTAA